MERQRTSLPSRQGFAGRRQRALATLTSRGTKCCAPHSLRLPMPDFCDVTHCCVALSDVMDSVENADCKSVIVGSTPTGAFFEEPHALRGVFSFMSGLLTSVVEVDVVADGSGNHWLAVVVRPDMSTSDQSGDIAIVNPTRSASELGLVASCYS